MTGEKCALLIATKNKNVYKNCIRCLKCKFQFMKLLQKIFYVKCVLFLVFNIGCRYFHSLISFAFNNFFVNKK